MFRRENKKVKYYLLFHNKFYKIHRNWCDQKLKKNSQYFLNIRYFSWNECLYLIAVFFLNSYILWHSAPVLKVFLTQSDRQRDAQSIWQADYFLQEERKFRNDRQHAKRGHHRRVNNSVDFTRCGRYQTGWNLCRLTQT